MTPEQWLKVSALKDKPKPTKGVKPVTPLTQSVGDAYADALRKSIRP